jgi:hypothetical protein
MTKANTSRWGKSKMLERMDELGYNVRFRCPTNKLIQRYEAANDKITSATINQVFNRRVGEEKKQTCDYSDYNVLC